MKIEKTSFLKSNLIALGISGLVFSYYLYTVFSGGRACGCDTTEKATTATNRTRSGGVHVFYHK